MTIERFINYYEMFGLDRSNDEKALKKELGRKQAEVSRLAGSTDRDDTETLSELQEMMEIIRNAIQVLSNPEARKQYDTQLASAEAAGRVDHRVSQKAQTILERAREFFKVGQYNLALEFATRAIHEEHIGSEEPFEIVARSQFMLGDYDDAIQSAENAAHSFAASLHLRWSYIRFLIMIEDYKKAQEMLYEAEKDFSSASLLKAEQVYLYGHAGNIDRMHSLINDYVASHPYDNEFRRYTAENLINLSQNCWLIDSAAGIMVITEADAYNRCLDFVSTANSLYQDESTKRELNDIRQLGELVDDEDLIRHKRFYHIGGAVLAFIGIAIPNTTGFIRFILITVGVLMQFLGVLVKKVGQRAYWEVYRDHYRGFKEKADGALYNILVAPLEMLTESLKSLIR